MMVSLLLGIAMAVPLELGLPTLAGEPVFPSQGNGFAAQLVGGIFGLVLIIGVMILLNRKRP